MANPKTKIEITAVDKTKAAFASVDRSIGGVAKSMNMLRGAAGGLAIAGAVRGLTQMVAASVKAADAVDKVSRAVGLSAESFQELSGAAELSGVGVSLFESSMTAFVKRVGEAANGMGPLTTGLKGWNDELLEAIKNSGSQEEAFNLLADATQKAGSASEVAALQNAAFGRSGIKMGNLMREGAEGVDVLRESFITLSDENVKTAAEMNDRWTIFFGNFKTGTENMVIDFLHAMDMIMTADANRTFASLHRELGERKADIAQYADAAGAASSADFRPGAPQTSSDAYHYERAKQRIAEIGVELGNNNRLLEEAKIKNQELAAVEDQRARQAMRSIGGGSRSSGRSGGKSALSREVEETTAAIEEQMNQLSDWENSVNSHLDSVAAGFSDTLVDGIMDGKMALEDFFKSAIAGFAKMYLQKQVFGPLFSSLGFDPTPAVSASTLHSGGIVGSAGTSSVMPLAAFAGAPRYHSGGIAGLAPDEVPAILQRGEMIIPKGQAAPGGSKVVNNIINNAGVEVSPGQSYQDSEGNTINEIIIEEMQNAFASGRMDSSMATNYGAVRRGF